MRRKALMKSALAWLLVFGMAVPNTALPVYAAESGSGVYTAQTADVPEEDGTQEADESKGEEDTAGDKTGKGEGDTAGDESGKGEGDTAGDESGKGEGDTAGDESGEGEGDTAGDESGKGEGDTAGDESGEGEEEAGDESGEGEEEAGDESGEGEEEAGDESGEGEEEKTAEDTDTAAAGKFNQMDLSWGVNQVDLDCYYTPANAGVTSSSQLTVVLEELDASGTVLARDTSDCWYDSFWSMYEIKSTDLTLKTATKKVRIRVTETVDDDAATEYVSDTYDRAASTKTPVFSLAQKGSAATTAVSYAWSVADYAPGSEDAHEGFELEFTYCPKENGTAKTYKTVASVGVGDYTCLSGVDTIKDLTQNTVYTVSAKIYQKHSDGTEVFSQTFTLPDVTTAAETEYTFAEIMPDAALRAIVAEAIDWTGKTVTASTEKIKRSQLEKATQVVDTREAASEAAVKSLKGIEYLTNLNRISLINHELTDISSVDWSKLGLLETLDFEGNDISQAVNLSALQTLKYLTMDENKLTEAAITSIKAKLPSSVTYSCFDDQRTEGVTLIAEPVYYRVGDISPLFFDFNGLKTGLDYQLKASIGGETLTLSKNSSPSYYYISDSKLAASQNPYTLSITVDGAAMTASFRIETQPLWYETTYCSQYTTSERVKVCTTETDKQITDVQMKNASGVVYGEKSGIWFYPRSYDERYESFGSWSGATCGVYNVYEYTCEIEPVYNRTPAGSYDLVLTYGDGEEETLTGAVQVTGENQSYISYIFGASDCDNTGDSLYLTIGGYNVDFTKLNYQATDKAGTVHPLSYLSNRADSAYGGSSGNSVVRLSKSDWRPAAGEEITVKVTAKDGYDIELLENTASITIESGVLYAEWNPDANAMEVAVSQDISVSSMRVEMRKLSSDNSIEDGEEFLSGETSEISDGFALVPMRNSKGQTERVNSGTYRIMVYLNGSEECAYNQRDYVSSENISISMRVDGPYRITQGTKGIKYYCYAEYSKYKDAAFRAEVTDTSGTVLVDLGSIGEAQKEKVNKNGTEYLLITVADSKDFCDLTPGSYYSLRLYYQTSGMKQESWTGTTFQIEEKGKFLLSYQDGWWISEDTIQLRLSTPNLADADKLSVQMYDTNGNEIGGLTTSVRAVLGDEIFFDIKGLSRDTAYRADHAQQKDRCRGDHYTQGDGSRKRMVVGC